MLRMRVAPLLIVLLVAGLAVRGWLIMEPLNSDPISYLLAGAGRSLNPDFHLSLHHHYLRPLMTWIVMLPAWFFGYSLTTFYSAVFMGALVSCLSWWLIATVLSGTRAALLVTALWATSYASLSADLTLVPDNWGINMALLGLAAIIIAIRAGDSLPESVQTPLRSHPNFLFFLGGMLLWAACAAKETFIIYVLVAGMVLLLQPGRWRRSGWVALGLGVGEGVEWLWFWMQLGDPFARIHYMRGINAVIDGVNIKFEPLDLTSFILRLPKVVHYTQSAESTLALLSFLGVFLWLRQWKTPMAKIKLLLYVVPPAFVMFAVKGIHPIQPYFDVVLRYHVPFLPFIYLAIADFFLWARERLGQTHGQTVQRAATAIIAVSVLALTLWNLMAAAHHLPLVKKNGFDANTRVLAAVNADVLRSGTPKKLYLGSGMENIGPLYFSAEEGWTMATVTHLDEALPKFPEEGYFILSWPRVNSDGNERPFVLTRLFHDYPLVFRHLKDELMTDVYRVGPNKINRKSTPFPGLQNKPWTLFDGNGQGLGPVMPGAMASAVIIPKNGEMVQEVAPSGEASMESMHLPAGTWLNLRFHTRTTQPFAILKGYLEHQERGPVPDQSAPEPMGVIYFKRVANLAQEISWATFIDQDLHRYRIIIKGEKGPVEIDRLEMFLLQPDPAERAAPFPNAK
ncbi:MAG: hypothetical protein HQL89_04420 [Magnetococcales bacterium]|nr:hypothetical protein [Magnetococcales bacterium]